MKIYFTHICVNYSVSTCVPEIYELDLNPFHIKWVQSYQQCLNPPVKGKQAPKVTCEMSQLVKIW